MKTSANATAVLNNCPPARTWFLLGKVALVAALTGCSAIEINVDVYKGSLTNDEATQLRQYAALAMSAHPVLTLLRNDLEWNRDVKPPDSVERDAYEPRHVFAKDSARYVNNMLSYYENRRSDAASLALLALRRAQDRVRAFEAPPADDVKLLIQRLDATLKNTTDTAQIRFLCTWRRVLSGEQQSGSASNVGCSTHLKALLDSNALPIDMRRLSVGLLVHTCAPLKVPHRLPCPADRSAHTGFKLLTDPRHVRSHAMALFGGAEPAFEAYVIRFAHGYIDSRQAMREVWQHSLTLLETHAKDPAGLRTAARMVADTTQTRLLACLRTTRRDRDSASQQMVHEVLGPAMSEEPLDADQRWDATQRPRARQALHQAALMKPVATVAVLRMLDAQARQRPATELQGCAALPNQADQNETVPEAERVQGLATGAESGEPFMGELMAMSRSVAALAPDEKFAWDRGRSDLGLFALYEQLLASMAQHQNDLRDDEVRRNAAALTEALVPFAERLLFVVNNSSLFQQQGSEDNFRTERSILQTLGNTLLLHANDLRRRRVHEDGQRAGFASELTAARQATLQGPAEVVENLRKHLENEVEKLNRAKDDAEKTVTAAKQRLEQAAGTPPGLSRALDAATLVVKDLPLPPVGLVEAHHTFFAASAPVLASADAKAPGDAEIQVARADARALRAHLALTLGSASIKPRVAQDAAVKWLLGQAGAKKPTLPRQVRLSGAAQYLKALALEGMADAPPAELLDGIARRVEAAGEELRGTWSEPLQNLQRASAAHTAAKRDHEAAVAAHAGNADQRDRLATALAKQQAAASAALSVLASALDQALKDGIDNPEGMRALVLKAVTTLPAGTGADAIAKAAGLVRGASLSTRFPFDRDDYARGAGNPDKPAATRIQVVDDVITLLRNRRIKALAAGESQQAAQLLTAIDAAYEHRTSLIFLRPAADYLRNVYAATALQDEARDPNRNMLLDYLRTLRIRSKQLREAVGADGAPASAEPSTRVEIDTTESKKELEKLFWQNINRVTLSGGGDANYAIAKDDVGNWYVKSYSSDPRQIFQSARNLLLFNQGARLDSNLLRRADLRQQAELETDPGRRTQALSELGKMDQQSSAGVSFAEAAQRRAGGRYLQETKNDIAALRAANDNLVPLLKARWQERLQALKVPEAEATEILAVLEPAAQRRLEAGTAQAFKDIDEQTVQALANLADAAQLGGRVLKVLDAMRLAGTGIEQMVEEQAGLKEPATLKAGLKAAAREVVGEQLRLAGERRQRSVAAYRDSLATLADAVDAP